MKLPRTILTMVVLALVVLATIWVGGVLSSRIGTPPSADEFLTSSDCASPCWRGIKPGKSRSTDVFRSLAKDNSIQSAGIHLLAGENVEGNTANAYLIAWIEPRNGQSDLVVMRNNLVELVQVSNYSQFTIGDAVQRFGPPRHIIVYGPEVERYNANFIGYWPDQGIVINSQMPYSKKLTLAPSSSVKYLTYFEPTSEERMWQIPNLVEYVNSRCTQANWTSWQGWVEVTTLSQYDCN